VAHHDKVEALARMRRRTFVNCMSASLGHWAKRSAALDGRMGGRRTRRSEAPTARVVTLYPRSSGPPGPGAVGAEIASAANLGFAYDGPSIDVAACARATARWMAGRLSVPYGSGTASICAVFRLCADPYEIIQTLVFNTRKVLAAAASFRHQPPASRGPL